jgi:hypothetical protein
MSTETLPLPPAVAVAPSTPKPGKVWLVAPWFDLFFVANLAWPVIFLISFFSFQATHEPLSLVQIYFLSTPHRWITLVLVFLDPPNFPAQPKRFALVGLALFGFAVVLAVAGAYHKSGMEALYLMMMADAVWNTWHFASQHAGIARIYARVGQRKQEDREIEFEKGAIRALVIWTMLRVFVLAASQPGGRMATYESWLKYLFVFDFFFLGQMLVVLWREFSAGWYPQRGRLIYILSVLSVYGLQLGAFQGGNSVMIKSAILVGAAFHAVEYLAIVSWSMSTKKGGVWTHLAPYTALFMVVFIAALGISNWALASQSIYLWTLLTLLVSFMHYGYDGMIWKSKPKPAAAPAASAA